MNIRLTKKDFLWKIFILLAILAALTALSYAVFANLGESHIRDYDEARHGINAYEMIRNDDYLVHTNQGETDYWNLKPPLSFWAIVLGYRLFGYTAYALRFHSALAVLLTGIAVACWFVKRKAFVPALIAVMAIVANAAVSGDHFGRTGEADALYQLFFTLAMLFMLSSGKRFQWLYLSAFCFGLAFLCKATHAFNIPAICFCYILLSGRIKELNVKRILLLALSGLCLIGPWMIMRYMRDGMAFFEGMVGTDVVNRLGGSAHLIYLDQPAIIYYFNMVFKQPMVMILLISSAIMFVTLLVSKVKISKKRKGELLGCLLWIALPVAFYSISDSRYSWYINSIHIALPVLLGLLLLTLIETNALKKWAALYSIMALACFGFYAYQNVVESANSEFDHSVQSFLRELYIREFDSETHVFIDYGENDVRTTADPGDWMPADLLTSYLYGDVICENGGAEAFEESDEYAILIMMKLGNEDLLDEFSGYYALRDETYYLAAISNH